MNLLKLKLNCKIKECVFTEDILFIEEVKNKINKRLLFLYNKLSIEQHHSNIEEIIGIINKYEIIDDEIILYIDIINNDIYECLNLMDNLECEPFGVGDCLDNFILLGFCINIDNIINSSILKSIMDLK